MRFHLIVAILLEFSAQCAAVGLRPEQIVEGLRNPEISTGNISDVVEAASGGGVWKNPGMKSL